MPEAVLGGDIGGLVRRLRKEKGLLQKDVAARLFCHKSEISHIENNKRPLTLESAWGLAIILTTENGKRNDRLFRQVLVDLVEENIKTWGVSRRKIQLLKPVKL